MSIKNENYTFSLEQWYIYTYFTIYVKISTVYQNWIK